jgi:hypothetical protein
MSDLPPDPFAKDEWLNGGGPTDASMVEHFPKFEGNFIACGYADALDDDGEPVKVFILYVGYLLPFEAGMTGPDGVVLDAPMLVQTPSAFIFPADMGEWLIENIHNARATAFPEWHPPMTTTPRPQPIGDHLAEGLESYLEQERREEEAGWYEDYVSDTAPSFFDNIEDTYGAGGPWRGKWKDGEDFI